MVLATAGVAVDTWWQYLLLFVAVAASWAGVPFIGATASGRRRGRRQPRPSQPGRGGRGGDGGGRGRWPHRLRGRRPLGPTSPGAPGQASRGTPENGREGRTGLREVGTAGRVLHARGGLGHGQDASRPVRRVEPDRVIRLCGLGRRERVRHRTPRHRPHLAPRRRHPGRRARRGGPRHGVVRPTTAVAPPPSVRNPERARTVQPEGVSGAGRGSARR